MKTKLSPKLMCVWLIVLVLGFGSILVVTIIGQEPDQVKEQIFKEHQQKNLQLFFVAVLFYFLITIVTLFVINVTG